MKTIAVQCAAHVVLFVTAALLAAATRHNGVYATLAFVNMSRIMT